MLPDQVKTVLKELGLNDHEQTIYLNLLQVGSAPASMLGQRSGIPKSTAQYTCQQLLKKGLISRLEKNNAYIYRREDPQRLLFYLDKKRKKIDTYQEHVQQIIGPLKEWMAPEMTAPRIRVYEGLEQVQQGLWTMLDSMKAGDEMLSYVHPLASTDPIYTEFFDILTLFGEERVQRKLFRKMLVADVPQAKEFMKDTEKYHWDIRVAPKKMFACEPAEIIIFNDTVWNLSIEQGYFFAYTAEHRSLTTLQRDSFALAWEAATKK